MHHATDKNEGWCCQQPHQQAPSFTACCWLNSQSHGAINYPPGFQWIKSAHNNQHGWRWWSQHQQQHPQRKRAMQIVFVEGTDMWRGCQGCCRPKCKARDIQWLHWHQHHWCRGLTIIMLTSGMVHSNVGHKVMFFYLLVEAKYVPWGFALVLFNIWQVRLQHTTTTQHNKYHHHGDGAAAPPAAWIWLIHAGWVAGGLAHILSKAAVEGFFRINKSM